MKLKFMASFVAMAFSTTIYAADVLTNVSLEVSEGRLSKVVECMVHSAIDQRIQGASLKKVLFSSIETADRDGLSKFASVKFMVVGNHAVFSNVFKITLASLDKNLGWYYLQGEHSLYPFTPISAVMGRLENQSAAEPADFFDISLCQ